MDRAPQRLQLFRGAKFDLQDTSQRLNGLPAIRIDRHSGWENPFLKETPTQAVETFRLWLSGEMTPQELTGCCGHGRFSSGAWLNGKRRLLLEMMPVLRGKNLACWCGLRDPCHGDVLLEVANASPGER